MVRIKFVHTDKTSLQIPLLTGIWTILGKLEKLLNDGKPARQMEVDESSRELLKELCLLSGKPVLYVANVKEEDIATGNQWVDELQKAAKNLMRAPAEVHITPLLIAMRELSQCEGELQGKINQVSNATTALESKNA